MPCESSAVISATASAPGAVVAEKLGIHPAAVAKAARRLVGDGA